MCNNIEEDEDNDRDDVEDDDEEDDEEDEDEDEEEDEEDGDIGFIRGLLVMRNRCMTLSALKKSV